MIKSKIYEHNTTLLVCLLAVFVLTAFLPSLKNNFVNSDDLGYVRDNHAIRSFSWENIKTLFTSFYGYNYQPVSMLSYSLEYQFYDSRPAGYHLTNLILHLLNSILVLWLIFILSDNLAVSFITAVLFGIHPLHVESVAWISERKDVLYAFFFLGAAISYFYYVKKGRASKYYYFSLVLFLLALLSKAMAVTLPLTLFLIDYALHRKPEKEMIIEKIPFFALSLIFGLVCVFSQNVNKIPYQLPLFFAGSNIIFYLTKILSPTHLCFMYPYVIERTITPFYNLLFLSLIFVNRLSRKIVFGIMLFLINILPVMPLSIVADRYIYIASIGIFYIIGEGFVRLYKLRQEVKIFLLTILIVIIGVLMLLTWKRCEIWKDSISLWSDVLYNYPGSVKAYRCRGLAYADNGKVPEAITDFTKAIRIDPNNASTCFRRGCAYDGQGDFSKAIHDYTRAIEIDTKNSIEAYNNRGSIYCRRGDFDLAIHDYNEIIELRPDFAKAYNDRAAAYLQKKEYDKSRRDVKKVKELGYEPDPELLSKLENVKQ